MNIGIAFTVTCKRCGCSMEFRTGNHTALSDKVVCQNCGQALPAESLAALLRAIEAMSALPSSTCSTENEGFEIDFDAIPSPWADDTDL